MISVILQGKVVLVAFKFVAIGGFMLGIEYLWEHKVLVLDLGIVRIFIARKSYV